MQATKFLMRDKPKEATTSFLIDGVKVPAPAYIPEIKSGEDIQALLKHQHAFPAGNPMLVPANRWMKDIESPIFRKGDLLKGIPPISSFLSDHPILFLDPPEFFRYTLGQNLVPYVLKGQRQRSKEFYAFLRKGDSEAAIELTHPFFHAFLEKQIASICKDKKIPVVDNGKRQSHVEEAWHDERVDEFYASYVFDVVNDALKMPHASIIPPVPVLLKSSKKSTISKIIGSNKVASFVCKSLSEANGSKQILPYFHLYIDTGIVSLENGNDINTISYILQEGLSTGYYSGVALTITGYQSSILSGKDRQLESLINEVVNIAHEHFMPVILPRSNLYGLYFTDLEIQAFSSMLNGNSRYTRGGGGLNNPDDRFGKVYLIEQCVELKLNEVRKYLEHYGEFPAVEGLSRKPTETELQNDRQYRVNWSKPNRLAHVEEARRMREAKLKGIINPAKLYFERSNNVELNSL